MVFLNNVPNCELKTAIIEKIGADEARYEGLLSIFQSVTTQISHELRHINELFPEYTPHDKDYHINHLFVIADMLLGKDRYNYMNAIELYLLMVSMYAHDWGMAVSKDERYYIATKKERENSDIINVLDDETDRFDEFIYSKFGRKSINDDEDITLDMWQEYLRVTHALRSGKRIEKCYEKENNSLAHALSKICVGHWLDIEEINDKNGYYMDASVCGENVNLKALTIYIRLIDLFDLAEDRTPYVIWKYVNPQNENSKMEWEKHRALHQITCPSYESGRVVCISGSTDNHEVYAALIDFKYICEKYFRECSDALAHMNDRRHELGVYFLDWRIEARNFKPISVKFDFERENIFKVLSDEIYNCHPYVFVRELIQNSVDAIKFRKEVLNRKKIGGDNIGYIYFSVNNISEDEIEIICQDDGIGMDEYIVKNYFSILGKSYYSSNDFEKERITMAPISKFGIGILSCFSVANQMLIETFREPYMGGNTGGLRIVISDIEKQFRVEEVPCYKCEVGTKIVLKVKKASLNSKLDDEYMKKINKYEDITSYIKDIIDFINYPIIINENDNKTILLNVGYDVAKLERELDNLSEYDIFFSSREYPVEHNVAIQDIERFNKIFTTKAFDLESDLGFEKIEGKIIFPILKDNTFDIKNETGCWPTNEISVTGEMESFRIRWIDETIDGKRRMRNGDNIRFYNSGFLLERLWDVYREELMHLRSHLFPTPYIKINFLSGISDISVSRFSSMKSHTIIKKIWKKIYAKIEKEIQNNLIEQDCYQFWKDVSIYTLQFYLDIKEMDKAIFTEAKYPFICEDGHLSYESIENLSEIVLFPKYETDILEAFYDNKLEQVKVNWEFGKCLFVTDTMSHFEDSINKNIVECIYKVISKDFYKKKINLLKVSNIDFPIIQYIMCRGSSENLIKEILELLRDFDVSLEKDKEKIKKIYENWIEFGQLIHFQEEYRECFAYGCRCFNLDNKITANMLKIQWGLNLLREANSISRKEWANYNDKFMDLPFMNNFYRNHEKIYNLDEINSELKEIRNWINYMMSKEIIEEVNISFNDFISKTIELIDEKKFKKIDKLEHGIYF